MAMDRRGWEAIIAAMLYAICCITAAIGWSIPAIGLFVDGETAFDWLSRLAGQTIVYQPMLDYWLRMMAAACTGIGFLFAWAAVDRIRTRPLARILAIFQLLCGCVLVWWAHALGISPARCAADILFCFVTGSGMLAALVGEERRSATPPA